MATRFAAAAPAPYHHHFNRGGNGMAGAQAAQGNAGNSGNAGKVEDYIANSVDEFILCLFYLSHVPNVVPY